MKRKGKRIFKSVLCIITAISLIAFAPVGVSATPIDGLPEKYDLRDEGLVTPVKFQNPWGTCWAFGGTAAIESSLLSYMGMTNDEYKAQNNGKDFDLSEKHIAWFALHPVTEDVCKSQVGEGVYPTNESGEQSTYYNLGGEM